MRWWPFALLAALAVAGASAPVTLLLCAVTGAWMLQQWWRGTGYVAGLIALTGALVLQTPWFGLFTPVAYVRTFQLLRWPWQPVGVGAVAVVAGVAQASGVDTSTAEGRIAYGAVLLTNVVPLCGFSWFLRQDERHQAERERALAEAREANRRLAASLAENAALHERLVAQARETGVRDERQRMAREIHDTLAQGLTGIISQLRAAAHADDDPERRRRHVAAASALAGESLTEARRSVHALRPAPLRTAHLIEALSGVAERWSALHGIPVRVTTTGTPRQIRPEAEAALLRVAQEALANVAKHAGATRVGVTLSFLDGEVALDVRDDGRGFVVPASVSGPQPDGDDTGDLDPTLAAAVSPPPSGTAATAPTLRAAAFAPTLRAAASAPSLAAAAAPARKAAGVERTEDSAPGPAEHTGGFGLIGMRQRMEELSGTLRIESEPGAGTGVSARVAVGT